MLKKKLILNKKVLIQIISLSLLSIFNMQALALNKINKQDKFSKIKRGEILRYISRIPPYQVLINRGAENGLKINDVLSTHRQSPGQSKEGDLLIKTGKVKITQVSQKTAIGEIIDRSTIDSKAVFTHNPNIMIGDTLSNKLKKVRIKIARKKQAISDVSLHFRDLFQDPGRNPDNYQLSAVGKKILQEKLAIYKDKKISKLLITAQTGPSGKDKSNQLESNQRAATIKQYLLNFLNYKERTILALGVGEKRYQENEPYKPDWQDRIIFIEASP